MRPERTNASASESTPEATEGSIPANARTRSAGFMSPYRRAETTFSPSSRTTFTVH